MCYTLIGLAWLHWCLQMCQSLIYMSFSDMMQGDNGNIKEVLGITLLIDYLAIYLIYCCIIVFCLYNETVLYNSISVSLAILLIAVSSYEVYVLTYLPHICYWHISSNVMWIRCCSLLLVDLPLPNHAHRIINYVTESDNETMTMGTCKICKTCQSYQAEKWKMKF